MSEQAIYRQSDKKLPYPRVLWICDCGYQLAIMGGYNPNWRSDDYGKIVLPTGICTKCGKPIKAI